MRNLADPLTGGPSCQDFPATASWRVVRDLAQARRRRERQRLHASQARIEDVFRVLSPRRGVNALRILDAACERGQVDVRQVREVLGIRDTLPGRWRAWSTMWSAWRLGLVDLDGFDPIDAFDETATARCAACAREEAISA